MNKLLRRFSATPPRLRQASDRLRAAALLLALLTPAFTAAQPPTTAAPDSVEEALAVDRSAAASDTAASDTAASDTAANDTAANDTAANDTAANDSLSPPDTSYRFWSKPYFGFAAGWTFGGFPLFDTWQNGLPKTLEHIGLRTPWPAEDDGDSVALVFSHRLAPDEYNVSFPLGASWFTPLGGGRMSVDLLAELWRKTSRTLILDSARDIAASIRQSLMAYSLTAGLSYFADIPATYFTVDNTRAASFSFGVTFTPLLGFAASNAVEETADDDSFPPIAEDIRGTFVANRAFGVGVGWRLGLSALKRYTATSGLEVGLYYWGQYQRFPNHTADDVQHVRRNVGESLSSIQHRFAVRFDFLRGKQPSPEETGDGPQD